MISGRERMLRALGLTYCAAQFLTYGSVFALVSGRLAYSTNPIAFVFPPMAAYCFIVTWRVLRHVQETLARDHY